MSKGTKILIALLVIVLCVQTAALFKLQKRLADVYAEVVYSDAMLLEQVNDLTRRVAICEYALNEN